MDLKERKAKANEMFPGKENAETRYKLYTKPGFWTCKDDEFKKMLESYTDGE